MKEDEDSDSFMTKSMEKVQPEKVDFAPQKPVAVPALAPNSNDEDAKMAMGGKVGQALNAENQQKLDNIMKALQKKPASLS